MKSTRIVRTIGVRASLPARPLVCVWKCSGYFYCWQTIQLFVYTLIVSRIMVYAHMKCIDTIECSKCVYVYIVSGDINTPVTDDNRIQRLLSVAHTLRKNNNIPNIGNRVNKSKSSHGILCAAVFCTWAVRFCSSFFWKKKTQQKNNFNFDLFVWLISIDFDFITMQPIFFWFCRHRRCCSCQYLCVLVLFSFDGRNIRIALAPFDVCCVRIHTVMFLNIYIYIK